MTPEDVTQEGFYFDPEDNEVVNIEKGQAQRRSIKGGYEYVGPEILICEGMIMRQDWPKELRGPLVIPAS